MISNNIPIIKPVILQVECEVIKSKPGPLEVNWPYVVLLKGGGHNFYVNTTEHYKRKTDVTLKFYNVTESVLHRGEEKVINTMLIGKINGNDCRLIIPGKSFKEVKELFGYDPAQ
jgi:hypothetical protein